MKSSDLIVLLGLGYLVYSAKNTTAFSDIPNNEGLVGYSNQNAAQPTPINITNITNQQPPATETIKQNNGAISSISIVPSSFSSSGSKISGLKNATSSGYAFSAVSGAETTISSGLASLMNKLHKEGSL